MGIIDFFKGISNPYIVDKFEYLYQHHNDGMKTVYAGLHGYNTTNFGPDIPFEAKKALVEKEDLIIKLDKAEKEAKRLIYKLEKKAREYPRAHIYFCSRHNLVSGYDLQSISMPGQRPFLSIPTGQPKALSPFDLLTLPEDGLNYDTCPDQTFGRLIARELNHYKYLTSKEKTPQIAPHIRKKDYSPLLEHLDEYEGKEKEILSLLERENLWHKIDTEILSRPEQVYFKEYLMAKYSTQKCTLDIYEEIAQNIEDFHRFVINFRASVRYDSIRSIDGEERDRRYFNLGHLEKVIGRDIYHNITHRILEGPKIHNFQRWEPDTFRLAKEDYDAYVLYVTTKHGPYYVCVYEIENYQQILLEAERFLATQLDQQTQNNNTLNN